MDKPKKSAQGAQEKPVNKQVGYKFVAYPICLILAVAMFIVVFFVVIPCINQYALVVFGDTMERLLVYYPTFICFDIIVAALGIWLTFTMISGITSFCRRHIRSSRTLAD